MVYADTGLGYLSASMVDEAKRWFERSTVLCRFVPDGRKRAEKVGKSAVEETGFITSRNRFQSPIATYWHVTRLDEAVARPSNSFILATRPYCMRLLCGVILVSVTKIVCVHASRVVLASGIPSSLLPSGSSADMSVHKLYIVLLNLRQEIKLQTADKM